MKTRLFVSMISLYLLLAACCSTTYVLGQTPQNAFRINLTRLKQIGEVDERFQSFNIEMVEVVGGDFWIPYAQIDTTRKPSMEASGGAGRNRTMYRAVPPINLYDNRLRRLAAALGPTYMRVSGTWANSTFFQNDEAPKLKTPPAGYKNVLSRQEWKGVIDFGKAINAKLITSFAISDGVRDKEGIWTPVQAKPLVEYTHSIGGEIAAAELFNEPTYANHGGAPNGYNAAIFAKDVAVFRRFVQSALPHMIVLGPGSVREGSLFPASRSATLTTDDLLSASPKPMFDVFSYHYYGAVSIRCLPSGPGGISASESLSPEWLHRTVAGYEFYKDIRDKYLPGKPIWLTETADAGCGGNPWGATFLDCFRYVEQLGLLARQNVKVVAHNTLSASEYGLLDQDSHQPRPNYWTALLWARFMGTRVYDAVSPVSGVDVFVHNLKNSQDGLAVLVVNTLDTPSDVTMPTNADQYALTADELQTQTVQLNGNKLALTTNDLLPPIKGKAIRAGVVRLPAHSIHFFTFAHAQK